MSELNSEAIQQLEKIAKAINALEGIEVLYSLARQLSAVAKEIAEWCAPEESER
jgi:hypothetical protein